MCKTQDKQNKGRKEKRNTNKTIKQIRKRGGEKNC